MARYSEAFIQQVRKKCDLLKVVGRLVKLRRSGANWFGLCPFHRETTPSFSVRPDKGYFKCFSCGKGGDVFTFLMETRGLDFKAALVEAARMAGLPQPDDGEAGPAVRGDRDYANED